MSKVTMGDALASGDGVILDELAARIKELEILRDELTRALNWYADTVEDLNRYGWTAGQALGQLRADRGKKAMEAIAKVKRESLT